MTQRAQPTRRAAAAALLGAPLGLLLAGCATPPARPPGSDWLNGRLSLRVETGADATTAPRQFSSAFELQGDAERGELRLTSPLGSVVAAARWSPDAAELVTSDGTRRYTDLDTLAQDTLGEALPLRALPSWLHGRPWPGAPRRDTADGFEQLGWQVDLARYADGWLEVRRSTAPAVTLRARIERS